jgi:hypothetical protein
VPTRAKQSYAVRGYVSRSDWAVTQRATKAKQSYTERGSVSRKRYSAIIKISNEREEELRRLELGIQKR